MGVAVKKPIITNEQMVKSSIASKHFGEVRKKAKKTPQFITDNGTIDSVLLGYEYYEQMYERLYELEEMMDADVLVRRIERFENNPKSAIKWEDIRKPGK